MPLLVSTRSHPDKQRNEPRETKSATTSEHQVLLPMPRPDAHMSPSPQPSAHDASPSPAHAFASESQYSPSLSAWVGESRSNHAGVSNSLSMLTEVYPTPRAALASVHASRPDQRHTPAACGERHDPLRPAVTSPRKSLPGPWRSLHFDDRRISTSQTTVDAPLSLNIPPQVRDPPKLATGTTSSSQTHSYATSEASTLLPSIALLNEHAESRYNDPNNAGSLSTQISLPCHCATLRPLLREFVDAVLELDESVQSLSRSPSRPRPNNIDSHPVQSVHWMLERLRQTKRHIDGVARDINTVGATRAAQPTQVDSTPTGSKRSAGPWDWDETAQKRPRSGASESMHQPFRAPAYDRPRSIEDARKDLSGYSPARADSIPGSAHPGTASPTFAQRAARALPSPSSITYSNCSAPSLPTLAAQSIASPATSYLPASSLHTAPAHPATSAHIAELQHQVTLKSLALQTLQSEYASLLQKLQREKVRSQAIEKKTSVADQEVNELTNKNEDLTEQVKLLTSQLEHSERKREAERSEAEREKNQWGRMLEMSGRLQAKADAEKQRLLAEKETLLQHVSRLRQPPKEQETQEKQLVTSPEDDQRRAFIAPRAQTHVQDRSDDLDELRRTVATQARRIELFKSALEQIRAQSAELDERAQAIRQRSSELQNISGRALNVDDTVAMAQHARPDVSAPPPSQAAVSTSFDRQGPDRRPPVPTPQLSRRSTTLDVLIDGRMQPANIKEVSRARTPGPDELGFPLPPTTSTSEELLSALGPVPIASSGDMGARGLQGSQHSSQYGLQYAGAAPSSRAWDAMDSRRSREERGQASLSPHSDEFARNSVNRTPDHDSSRPVGDPKVQGSGPAEGIPPPRSSQVQASENIASASDTSSALLTRPDMASGLEKLQPRE
ncbi:hypothetical protein CKM354_000271500 [Cercospora kikuchii]|uniref:Uncharacterized protein n=1 Tax=Cercospora kikuchii TaxID=84275 RepID=A0A9P3CIT3_9PEZI|nr:uncharacterized protein CKM354_000271500 [Cercospora kikuchii]GIZ39328.1 hypothetical protein CKM354_000271500 [Cercospora kikuchii]